MDNPELKQLLHNLDYILKCENLGKKHNIFNEFGLGRKWLLLHCQINSIREDLKKCSGYDQEYFSNFNGAINHLLCIESGKVILGRDSLENSLENLHECSYEFQKSIVIGPKGKIKTFQK